MIKLLHIEKNIPNSILSKTIEMQKQINASKMVLSRHIQEHLAGSDHKHDYTQKGLLECMQSLSENPVEPFEVEIDSNCNNKNFIVTKYVVRIPYDSTYDISIAIRGNMIVTAWLNRTSDTHKTLDLSKYAEDI